MAPSSDSHAATPQEVSARVGPPMAGTRHITMYTDHTHKETIVKFINVPDVYDLSDVKHADHVGMFWTFNNGETWLVLNDKRLFVTLDYGDGEIEAGAGWPEDWPVMSPEELKVALMAFPPLEEYQAMLAAATARQEDDRGHSDLQERLTCQKVGCQTSDN